MIKPYQKDEKLLHDIRSSRMSDRGFRIWWLGQSGFLLQWKGKHLLFDPYLSDSLTRKYADTDKPHVRMSERVIDPAELTSIDIITSSHNHTDHLDAETLLPLLAGNPGAKLVIPEANRTFVADRLQCDPAFPTGLNDGQSVEVGEFRFTGIPAAHNELNRDGEGRCPYLGYIAEFGPYRVYHSGDTLWFNGLEEVLRPFSVDVAFLPINGNKPERRVAGNLSAEEAARLGREIGARCVIPHHYHLFAFNTEDPLHFIRWAEKYGTPYHVPELGASFDIP